jgi:hypothetical protein
MAGDTPANGSAKWDGSNWSALGNGMFCVHVTALAAFDGGDGPALYAGGLFLTAGDMPARNIAKWDGANWTPLGSGVAPNTGTVQALTVFDAGEGAALYGGSLFGMAGNTFAFRVARWDGATWSDLDVVRRLAEGVRGGERDRAGLRRACGLARVAGHRRHRTRRIRARGPH